MFDIIGDIHGHATPLKQLLIQLDYQYDGNSYRHPQRKVIFLGDYIDRGPDQVEVYRIVRAMVDADQAIAIMGNHELNAVLWTIKSPNNPDQFLRPHTTHNRKQHDAFLQQVGENSDLHAEIIEWFRTLPLCYENNDFRAVHAYWNTEALEYLKQQDFIDSQYRISNADAWKIIGTRGSQPYLWVEQLLKGIELPLPEGVSFFDKDGKQRFEVRVRWWLSMEFSSFAEVALLDWQIAAQLEHITTPVFSRYEDEKLLFIGHYWMTGHPERLSPYVACLDFSIGKAKINDSKLGAYRYHNEKQLNNNHFSFVVFEGEN